MDPAGDGWRRIDPPDGEFERTGVGKRPLQTGAVSPHLLTVADQRASSSPQDDPTEGFGL